MPDTTPPTWPKHDLKNGVLKTVLSELESVHKIVKSLLDSPQYVFRGQREAEWLLEPSLSERFKGESKKVCLLKALIPKSERIECLKALNVMNINHATLFPDLYGAGKHATEVLRRKIGK